MNTQNKINPVYAKVEKRDAGRCTICGQPTPDSIIQTRADFNFLAYFEKRHTPTAADFVTVCEKCGGQYAEKRRKYDRSAGTGRPAPYLRLTPGGFIEMR